MSRGELKSYIFFNLKNFVLDLKMNFGRFITICSLLLIMNSFINASIIYINEIDLDLTSFEIYTACEGPNNDCKPKRFYTIPRGYNIDCPKGTKGLVHKDTQTELFKVVALSTTVNSKKIRQFEENCKKLPNYMKATFSSNAKTIFRKTTPHMPAPQAQNLEYDSSLITNDNSLHQDSRSFETANHHSSTLGVTSPVINKSSSKSFPATMADGTDDIVWAILVFLSAVLGIVLDRFKKRHNITKPLLPVTLSTPSNVDKNIAERSMPEMVVPQLSTAQSTIQTYPPTIYPSFQESIIPFQPSALTSNPAHFRHTYQEPTPQSTVQSQHPLHNPSLHSTAIQPQMSQVSAPTLLSDRTTHQEPVSQLTLRSSYYPAFTPSLTPSYGPQASAPTQILPHQEQFSQSTNSSQSSSHYSSCPPSLTSSNESSLASILASRPPGYKPCGCEKGSCVSGSCRCLRAKVPCTILCHNQRINSNCRATEEYFS